MYKVAVLGAGVNGLTCALKIKEKYTDFQVLIISNELSPNTTGDGSGGLWYPYLCGNSPGHLLTKWGGETYNFLHELWLEGGHEVCLVPTYSLNRDRSKWKRPEWAKVVFGYQELEGKQLEHLSRRYSAEYVAGHTFNTFVVPPVTLMSYLYQRFKNANGDDGVILQAKVTSLQDPILNEYDVVVNCTGMGARDVVPDEEVFPIRGQVAKVNASWITECVVDEDGGNYIIPNAETCVLGGTHQDHDYNTKVDDRDTDFILNGCKRMVPGLENMKVINHWAGLRPGRYEIRLESEQKGGKFFIHNYGHGGSGLTLFWGCGTDVLDILTTYIDKKSKL